MAFYYNRFSDKNIQNQWGEYYQNKAYISDIDGIITQSRKELQYAIQSASSEQKKALQQVCGSINEGFSQMSQHLTDINYNISELRGEINEMASMLDWKLSVLIEEQRVTNQLLGHIAQLLRIPDSQKQRVYHIEKGLKYLKSAIPDGSDSEYYDDSMESLKEAEKIERKDYITLNRIGQIFLYSKKYFNVASAKEYFLKSAREASVEANAGGTTISNSLNPIGQLSIIYSDNPFKAAAAEAYLYASRTCYLEQNLSEAAELAGKAYSLIPEFVEAGFEQAKYLAANGKEEEAAKVLWTVIKKDRYFSLKTLSDQDLASKPAILKLLEIFQSNAIYDAQNKLDECSKIIQSGSEAETLISEIKKNISKNNFLSGMKALDLLNAEHNLPYNEYYAGYNKEEIIRRTNNQSQKLFELIKNENRAKEKLSEMQDEKRKKIITEHLGIGLMIGGVAGFIIGFFRGCSLDKFSMDEGTWFGTLGVFAVIGLIIGFISGSLTTIKIKNN